MIYLDFSKILTRIPLFCESISFDFPSRKVVTFIKSDHCRAMKVTFPPREIFSILDSVKKETRENKTEISPNTKSSTKQKW